MNKTFLIIGDPSGIHTLRLIERGISPDNITVWEDTTKGMNCVKMSNVSVTNDLEELNGMKFDVIVGNPPYGSGGNDAIKFLNKCGDLSDDVRLVLPLSLRKVSCQNKVRLDMICVEDTKLPDDTFPGSIRTVLQRWVKTDTVREKVKTFTTHPDFEFVKKEEADCMIGRAGSGPAGRLKTSDFLHYKDDHYFIKENTPGVIDNLGKISDELREISGDNANGMRTLSKHELITTYIKHFGRSKIEKPSTHPDFEFLRAKDPLQKCRANLFIGEAGGGPSGRVKTENFMHYANFHHFLYVEKPEVIERLVSLGDKFRSLAMNCNGRPHLSKKEIVEIYTEEFGV